MLAVIKWYIIPKEKTAETNPLYEKSEANLSECLSLSLSCLVQLEYTQTHTHTHLPSQMSKLSSLRVFPSFAWWKRNMKCCRINYQFHLWGSREMNMKYTIEYMPACRTSRQSYQHTMKIWTLCMHTNKKLLSSFNICQNAYLGKYLHVFPIYEFANTFIFLLH